MESRRSASRVGCGAELRRASLGPGDFIYSMAQTFIDHQTGPSAFAEPAHRKRYTGAISKVAQICVSCFLLSFAFQSLHYIARLAGVGRS